MDELKDLTNQVNKFRDDRHWRQFHNPKDLSMSVAIEAAELMEKFQWSKKNTKEYIDSHKEEIGEELADVVIYLLFLADDLGLDVKQIVEDKLKKQANKYPVDKFKGTDKKYNVE